GNPPVGQPRAAHLRHALEGVRSRLPLFPGAGPAAAGRLGGVEGRGPALAARVAADARRAAGAPVWVAEAGRPTAGDVTIDGGLLRRRCETRRRAEALGELDIERLDVHAAGV